MTYVHTWIHRLNNVRVLVSNFSKEHRRLFASINKLQPYGESHLLLPAFFISTYECITNAIVSSIAAGRLIIV